MCIFLIGAANPAPHTKGRYFPGHRKLRKRWVCDYCGQRQQKGTSCQWVDGLRSCPECDKEWPT